MRKLILFISLFLCGCTGNAQFRYVFPAEPSGHNYNDTLLNTRAILAKAGIKKITIHKNAREGKKKAFMVTRMLIDSLGGLISTTWCLGKPNSDLVNCMTDSIIYDAKTKERILMGDVLANGTSAFILKSNTVYLNDSVSKTTNRDIYFPRSHNITGPDSSFEYNYFNKKGQLTGTVHVYQNDSTFSWYKYSSYGFADTVYIYYPKAFKLTRPGIYVYSRFERDGLIIIQNWTNYSVRKWIYNEAGQCIRYSSLRNKNPSLNLVVYYDYNHDGTLSEVKVEKGDKAAIKYFYSYSK